MSDLTQLRTKIEQISNPRSMIAAMSVLLEVLDAIEARLHNLEKPKPKRGRPPLARKNGIGKRKSAAKPHETATQDRIPA